MDRDAVETQFDSITWQQFPATCTHGRVLSYFHNPALIPVLKGHAGKDYGCERSVLSRALGRTEPVTEQEVEDCIFLNPFQGGRAGKEETSSLHMEAERGVPGVKRLLRAAKGASLSAAFTCRNPLLVSPILGQTWGRGGIMFLLADLELRGQVTVCFILLSGARQE